MANVLCLSVTFLDPVAAFHGRRDAEEPEWPPSPLRIFQALVASAASGGREQGLGERARQGLEWLERQKAPVIVTPQHHVGVPVRIAVPNNDLDVVATAWAKGQEPKKAPSELKALKTVRPTRLLVAKEDQAIAHYLFPLDEGGCPLLAAITDATRGVSHLGWGVDMVAATASVLSDQEANELPGERWLPQPGGGAPLRTPIAGTLAALDARHAAFLNRLGPDGFTPVPPLTAFAAVGYRRATDLAPRPFAAFSLLTPNAERRWGRDARLTTEVAAMLRHATGRAAARVNRDDSWVRTFVHGHGSGKDGQAVASEGANRFAYLPLPTIRPQGVVGQVNRVLVAEPVGGSGADVAWARRVLAGQELIREQDHQPVALLSPAPESDWVIQHYTGGKYGSAVWSTVTPVVLNAHDSDNPNKIRNKLRRAIQQAGFPQALADNAQLEWRRVGFRPGADLATRYAVPNHLQNRPRYHVWLRWRGPGGQVVRVGGPVAVGDGRYCGLGLFAADPADGRL